MEDPEIMEVDYVESPVSSWSPFALKRVSPTRKNSTIREDVAFLMRYSKCTDTEFAQKAIESLLKRVKEREKVVAALEKVLRTSGSSIGPCIPIESSADGRLQVSSKKTFPSLLYTRIFRWPEAIRNEVHSIAECVVNNNSIPFPSSADGNPLVCCNPYHYNRTTTATGGARIGIPARKQSQSKKTTCGSLPEETGSHFAPSFGSLPVQGGLSSLSSLASFPSLPQPLPPSPLQMSPFSPHSPSFLPLSYPPFNGMFVVGESSFPSSCPSFSPLLPSLGSSSLRQTVIVANPQFGN